MFGNIGSGEIILIILFILIFFGAKKLPELAQGLGKGIREFRKAAKDVQRKSRRSTRRTPKARLAQPGILPSDLCSLSSKLSFRGRIIPVSALR